MEYQLRVGLDVEIIDLESFYLIADHINSRYIKVKRNEYVEFIFKNINFGIGRDELLNRAKYKNLIVENVNILLDELLKKGILENAGFPNGYIEKFGNTKKLIETVFNERFGYEIEWLTYFEREGADRFKIFQNIQGAKVIIIGAGGVGSNVAVLLAALGIGELTIIDADIVEESNLVRQLFYKESDCGKMKKITALKNYISQFSSYTKVKVIDAYIKNNKDAQKYLEGSDIIIQTADTPRGIINEIVSDYCQKSKSAVLFCSNGTIGPFYMPNVSSCYRCFEKTLNEESNGLYDMFVNALRETPSRVSPSVGMGPWLIAYYVCNEILQYFTNPKKIRTLDHYIRISDMGFKVEVISFEGSKDCACKCRGDKI